MPTLKELETDLVTNPKKYTFELAEEGVSGTYFIKMGKQHVGVFKDASQDPLSPTNPRFMSRVRHYLLNLVKPLGFYTAVRNTVSGQSYVSDHISSLFAEKLGLKHAVVPQSFTTTLKMGDKEHKGTLIEWVNDASPLTKYTNFRNDLVKLPSEKLDNQIPVEAFEEAAIFDFLTGNLDRKAGNFLVNTNDSGKLTLYLIDNSWAFSPKQGESFSLNQYDWGKFSVLKSQKFSDENKMLIQKVYDERYQYAKIIFNEYCKQNPTGETVEVSYERAMRCLHRIEMLHFFVCKKNQNFSSLSEVKFEDTYLKLHRDNDDLSLSSHFIDTNLEQLTAERIKDIPTTEFTIRESEYDRLYKRPDLNNSVTSALHQELIRLCQKKANRNWSGIWRKKYDDKAKAVIKAAEKQPEQKIINDVKDSTSDLYKALNTHSSFFFKFSKSSTKTTALLNMEKAVKQLPKSK